ncbi:hypothetical protein ACX1NX_02910 [Acinetobacter sp. ANC 5383]
MTQTYFGDVNRTTRPFSLDASKERRSTAKPTTATAYKVGDLLTLSAANVLTHATDASTWNVICGMDLTAAEATAMAANGGEFPIYHGGEFNIEAISIEGTALTTGQYTAAKAKATLNKIEFVEF